jgi:hypothetical protein
MDEFDQIIADFALHEPKAPAIVSFFKPKVVVIDEDGCKTCGGTCYKDEMLSSMICNKCGVMSFQLIEQCKPSNHEQPNQPTYTPYLRLNHFKEVLTQMQGKQQTSVPEQLLDDVRTEMARRGWKILTLVQIRTVLKHIKQSKYYEHAVFILEKLGQKVPHLGQALEDKLIKQFLLLQQSYQTHAKDDRANFLNYYYTLYKLLEMEGRVDCLSFIPMLSTRTLTATNDSVWRHICIDLGWVYKPTV